jgi:hypothetical protein
MDEDKAGYIMYICSTLVRTDYNTINVYRTLVILSYIKCSALVRTDYNTTNVYRTLAVPFL